MAAFICCVGAKLFFCYMTTFLFVWRMVSRIVKHIARRFNKSSDTACSKKWSCREVLYETSFLQKVLHFERLTSKQKELIFNKMYGSITPYPTTEY